MGKLRTNMSSDLILGLLAKIKCIRPRKISAWWWSLCLWDPMDIVSWVSTQVWDRSGNRNEWSLKTQQVEGGIWQKSQCRAAGLLLFVLFSFLVRGFSESKTWECPGLILKSSGRNLSQKWSSKLRYKWGCFLSFFNQLSISFCCVWNGTADVCPGAKAYNTHKTGASVESDG